MFCTKFVTTKVIWLNRIVCNEGVGGGASGGKAGVTMGYACGVCGLGGPTEYQQRATSATSTNDGTHSIEKKQVSKTNNNGHFVGRSPVASFKSSSVKTLIDRFGNTHTVPTVQLTHV